MKSPRVRFGLLGTARINDRLAPAMSAGPRSELVAVASRGGQVKADEYAARLKIPRAYGTYEGLLADPEVDAVYISLPNALHIPWAIRAIERGKHVLCEKPLACSAEEVERAAEAARRKGVHLQEAVMMRYHPQTQQLAGLVAEGVIGDVRLIQGVFSFTLARPGDIRLDPALGGGSIWDLGSYPVGFIRAMLGANPLEVHGWRRLSESGVDLSFAGSLRFESGAVGQFFSSFESSPRAEAHLLGSKGKMHVEAPYLNRVGEPARTRIWRTVAGPRGTFADTAPFEEEVIEYSDVNAYQDEVTAFVASVLDGAEPLVSLADSRDNVATLEALSRSAETGRPVEWA